MPIASSLQRFVDDELARSTGLIERALTDITQALVDAKRPASATAERGQHLKLLDALRRQAGPYASTFVHSLRRSVLAALHDQHDDALPGAIGSHGKLELMDESRVEIDIEVSRATQAIETVAEWELRELQTFTSTLAGQTHVTADTNPLRPMLFATALWDAAGEVTSLHASRAALLQTSAGVLAVLLKQAFAAACTRLESQGVEPGVYRTVVLVPGSMRQPETADPQTRPLELLAGLSNASSPGGQASVPVGQAVADYEQALLGLEALLSRAPVEPIGRDGIAALQKRMTEQHVLLRASASGGSKRDAVDLLSRLFEAIVADSQLNAALRVVLARLEGSALRIAARDDGVLQSYEHPVWQLINRIGDSADAYPQPGDPRLAALLPFCQALTDEVGRALHPDAALYRRALARLETFLAEQLQWQVKAARPTIEALTRTEQRELLQQQLSQRLANEFASAPATPGVRRFMTGPWAQVLAESMLRFGQEGETTVAYLKVVDDLLWSVKLPDHPQSRQRLIALLPDLLQRLRAGMALIALPQPDQQAMLDELMAIHTEALRPGARNKPDAPDAAEIVRRMRDEVLPSAPGALPDGDSVIDSPSMQTVPAELMPTDPPAAFSPARQIDAMQPGGRYRLFVHGRWSRTQLLWRSPQGRLFLFAGENPARPHSITRRALERLGEAGLAHLQTEATLIQRTADALVRNLTLAR